MGLPSLVEVKKDIENGFNKKYFDTIKEIHIETVYEVIEKLIKTKSVKEKKCLWCNKSLPKPKKKYCNDDCKYRHQSAKKENSSSLSKSQCFRMIRAGNKQRQGKLGVRFN